MFRDYASLLKIPALADLEDIDRHGIEELVSNDHCKLLG